ncbi:hypothetical protein TNCV_2764161 [Trichonephila clavipes]|nr:hypothetical protein TNCV_2764161 [Trichonephila clavipes]
MWKFGEREMRTHTSSLSLDVKSELRGPSPISFVFLSVFGNNKIINKFVVDPVQVETNVRDDESRFLSIRCVDPMGWRKLNGCLKYLWCNVVQAVKSASLNVFHFVASVA